MGFTARDYYNSTPDDCCETDVGPDVAGVGGFDLGCKPGMATLGAGAGLLFFGSFPAVLAGGALGWLLGKEKGERVGSVGFIAIGKKAKAHQEKKRAFEIKEMQRAEAKAAAEAEIEKLELEIKRATLVKQAQEAGVAVPASLVRAVQQKVAVAEKKVAVAEKKAEKAEAAAIIAGLAVGAAPRVHFDNWRLNTAASELLISARTLGRLTRAGVTPSELEQTPDYARYKSRLQAFNGALAEYWSDDAETDLDEFYSTHDRIANESGLPRLGDKSMFKARKRFEVPVATTWTAKQKAARVAANRRPAVAPTAAPVPVVAVPIAAAPRPTLPPSKVIGPSAKYSMAAEMVQQALKDQGYLPSTPDGLYGSKTFAAVKRFQADHGLEADGYVGPDTNAALFPAVTGFQVIGRIY